MSAKQKHKQHITTFSMTAQNTTVHKFKQLIKQTNKTLESASLPSVVSVRPHFIVDFPVFIAQIVWIVVDFRNVVPKIFIFDTLIAALIMVDFSFVV